MGTYLVVGGSSGIGKQIAQDLAQEGHQVHATYHQHPLSSEGNISYHTVNVLDEKVDFTFLSGPLDGVVYCPGAISLRPFARMSPTDFYNDYHLQVVGAVKVIQAVLPLLKEAPLPSIILFSTIAVQVGLPYHALVASSKGALEGLTKSLAAEFAPTIRVNCIAPSLTNTPLATSLLNSEQKIEANAQRHPLKRIGSVNDIASMASFLLSEKASWITGQIIHVDGGMSTIK